MNTIEQQEKHLEQAILEKDREKSLQILLDLTAFYAQKKNFKKAEQCRDRLYDIDPLALAIIVRANEIIEEEKISGINQEHREQFAGLYNILSNDQGNALFYALEEVTFPQNQIVYRQGNPSHGLFFVDKGKLRVDCRQGNRNVFIMFLLPGTIFGTENFFSSSLCTTSIVAVSDVNLHKLDKEIFSQLKTEHPGLEGALKRYATNSSTVSDHLLQNNMDRRGKTRKAIFGKTAIYLLSDSGNTMGKPIRVELNDISPNGTSFLLRITNEEKADIMLGQKIIIGYNSEALSPPLDIRMPGTIVGLTPNLFDDYTFHIKFDHEIEPSQLERIITVFSKTK